MSTRQKSARFVVRGIALLLVVAPLFFWKDFTHHFRAYLTGTVLNEIITKQWAIVVVSIIGFLLFLIPLSFRRKAKWAEYGLVAAFFVSLFVEMYGVPLTILFASKYFFTDPSILPPNVVEFDFLGVGFGMDAAMAYGAILMILGTMIILIGWISLYRGMKQKKFVDNGIYALSRHPQYVGFLLVILGWFIGWPTILTVIFTPILVYKYIRVCVTEEKEMMKVDTHYEEYKNKTPFLI